MAGKCQLRTLGAGRIVKTRSLPTEYGFRGGPAGVPHGLHRNERGRPVDLLNRHQLPYISGLAGEGRDRKDRDPGPLGQEREPMTNDQGQKYGSLLALASLALVAGALAGLVGAIFRLFLEQADR